METREEWTKFVIEENVRIGNNVEEWEGKYLWKRPHAKGFVLSEQGYIRFCSAGITFFPIPIPNSLIWTSKIILGMSRISCPVYVNKRVSLLLTNEELVFLYIMIGDFEEFLNQMKD